MFSKREVLKMAKIVLDSVFAESSYKPKTFEIRFVKNSPKRVLKFGFCRLVPGHHDHSNLFKEHVVIHVRDIDRSRGKVNLLHYLAHEFIHARQILERGLSQDPKTGVITYCGQEYVHRYNVFFRRHQVTPRGSFKAIYPPWEYSVRHAQDMLVFGMKGAA
jgi:hypothetical protein